MLLLMIARIAGSKAPAAPPSAPSEEETAAGLVTGVEILSWHPKSTTPRRLFLFPVPRNLDCVSSFSRDLN